MMRKRSFGVLVTTGMLLVAASACSSGSSTSAADPTPGAAATSAAAAASTAPATETPAAETPAAAATTAQTASRPLARVFPDLDTATCTDVPGGLRTGTGATSTEAYSCDYSAAAPGARVVFAQWPDAASAQAWYQDTANLGPRLESFETWATGGVAQGPLYTAVNNVGAVYSTGIYENSPYGWEIQAASLDEVNAVGPQLTLQQSSAFAG